MSRCRDDEFVPRRGNELRVVSVSRISTPRQDRKSNDDQEAFNQGFIRDRTTFPCFVHSIKTQAGGECLDRAELFELIELIESGEWDVVICEDLGRICRRNYAIQICEMCEDSGTRLIAINDNVDTAKDDWMQNSYFATMRHESYNKDTSKRIRRTQRHRFVQGGNLPKQIWGYIRPLGAKTDDEIQKDPEAEPVIRKIFQRLEDGGSYAAVADWLNSQNIPTGPACRTRQWNGTLLGKFVKNDLLVGMRYHNREKSKRINKSGKRACIPAPPEELLERHCPHLAFLDVAYRDHVLSLVKDRNKNKGRPTDGEQPNPRLGMPTKRTLFPSQHAICGICGRKMLMTCQSAGRQQITCSGGMDHKCWHSLYVDVDLTQREISRAVLAEIRSLDGFVSKFLQQLETAIRKDSSNDQAERTRLERLVNELTRKIKNLTKFIADHGDSAEIRDQLSEYVAERKTAQYELSKFDRPRPASIVIPKMEEIATLVEETFAELGKDDEAHRLLCRVLPSIIIRPVELCDSMNVEPQAIVELDLSPLAEHLAGHSLPSFASPKRLVVNLFEPRPYVQHAPQLGAIEQRGSVVSTGYALGLSLGEIGMARKLFRIMRERGLQSPWVPINDPPSRGWKGKRHLHPRYQFEPLPGFERPVTD
ncbi:recombinase family protein [Schlesneria paludicola]|uniref:recombinase family protein n=1 Tax=Schlesneria paludicola TaxID=360056 RepID=UPI00029A5E6F|nr:recombinase family protein [Schlesneria paludicola]